MPNRRDRVWQAIILIVTQLGKLIITRSTPIPSASSGQA
jgi:hypothetical protein